MQATRPNEASINKPWYRQFWPWFLIVLPLTSVLGGVTTLFVAMSDPDGLVVGDYYKQGLAINRTLAKEQLARTMGLTGRLRVDVAAGDLALQMDSPQPLDGAPLTLKFVHATRAHHDVDVLLRSVSPGHYVAALEEPLRLGGWLLDLQPLDQSWRLSGRLDVRSEAAGARLDATLAP